jgi:hypothetical protein
MRIRKTPASLRLGSAGPLMLGGCERRLLSRVTKETTLARDSVSKRTKPLGQVFERPTPPPIHCWEGEMLSLARSQRFEVRQGQWERWVQTTLVSCWRSAFFG